MSKRWILLFFIPMSAVTASATLPPVDFIVKTWAKTHKSIKNLKIQSTILSYQDDHPTDTQFQEVWTYHAATQSFESAAWSSLRTGNGVSLGTKLFSAVRPDVSVSPVSSLLVSSQADVMIDALKSVQVSFPPDSDSLVSLPNAVSPAAARTIAVPENSFQSLGRLDERMDRMGWVVGTADPRDKTRPQVWFEKDSFYPMKLWFTPSSLKKFYEIRFEEMQPSHSFFYPRLIKVKDEKGAVLFSVQLTEITSLPHVVHNTALSAGKSDQWTAEGEASSGSLKELIQLYYDIIR